RSINRTTAKPAEVAAEPAPEAADITLLREIRDALTKQG
ncbi:MAG: large conductance mechanosensitive channel protein MscL, partial [Sphingomonas hengshuiensis]